ncbi:hypothetical protein LCGC14_2691990 [marine sediment metagenome]|uniref:HD domain-containing protein n=1 Tax=marine sediment metagenome TaxID=412755 RepID=A0A0F8ZI99_9ZZZZ
MSRLTDLLSLDRVPRWVVCTTIKAQSVAEHSYRVTVIAVELALRLGFKFNTGSGFGSDDAVLARVLFQALVHDGPECATGDIPHPAKDSIEDQLIGANEANCPWVRDLPKAEPGTQYSIEDFIVRAADRIECIAFAELWASGIAARSIVAQEEQRLDAMIAAQRKEFEVQGRSGAYPNLQGIVLELLNEVTKGVPMWVNGKWMTLRA